MTVAELIIILQRMPLTAQVTREGGEHPGDWRPVQEVFYRQEHSLVGPKNSVHIK